MGCPSWKAPYQLQVLRQANIYRPHVHLNKLFFGWSNNIYILLQINGLRKWFNINDPILPPYLKQAINLRIKGVGIQTAMQTVRFPRTSPILKWIKHSFELQNLPTFSTKLETATRLLGCNSLKWDVQFLWAGGVGLYRIKIGYVLAEEWQMV